MRLTNLFRIRKATAGASTDDSDAGARHDTDRLEAVSGGQSSGNDASFSDATDLAAGFWMVA